MLDQKCLMILDDFKRLKPQLDILCNFINDKLHEIASSLNMMLNSIETRVKSEKSLEGKLDLKGYKYNKISDITDLVGARVVTFYSSEVDLFATKITEIFDVDWNNSVDKRKAYNVDQFGYMSLHYVVRIPKEVYFNPEFPEINDIPLEIQLRSVLQHIWAVAFHDTGYKSNIEIPAEYLRKLNRLAGLLEIADDSFDSIRTSLADYRRRVQQIVKSGKFDDVELSLETFIAYVDNGAFEQLNNKIATINQMEIQKVDLRRIFPIFKELFAFKTLKELSDLIDKYSDLAYRFCIYQFEGTDIDIITTMTGVTALLVVALLSYGRGPEMIAFLLENIYGPRKSNNSIARRYYSIGIKMGLVKEEGGSNE